MECGLKPASSSRILFKVWEALQGCIDDFRCCFRALQIEGESDALQQNDWLVSYPAPHLIIPSTLKALIARLQVRSGHLLVASGPQQAVEPYDLPLQAYLLCLSWKLKQGCRQIARDSGGTHKADVLAKSVADIEPHVAV